MRTQAQLSRRERQIMDVIYRRGEASVLQIQQQLSDPPTATALRTLLRILEDKGHVCRRKEGREFFYCPTQPKTKAGADALRHVLTTFYEGSIESALAAHLTGQNKQLTEDEARRLMQMIRAAREKGQSS